MCDSLTPLSFLSSKQLVIYELKTQCRHFFFGITNFVNGEGWCTTWVKRRLPLYFHLPIKCMARYWHSGTVEVQDTSRHDGLRCSMHRWPKASLVVEKVDEAVTTG